MAGSEPKAVGDEVLTPSEIVGASMRLMTRNLAIASALQSTIATGIRNSEIEGVDAARALAAITGSSLAIEKIAGIFQKLEVATMVPQMQACW